MSQTSVLPGTSRLAVAYRSPSELIPDPRNARTHPKRQLEQIKASIAAFGFTNPILADPDGNIIAGHGRQDISFSIINLFKRRQSFKSRLLHAKRRLRELLVASRNTALASANVSELKGGQRGQ
jgi:hypothetical protein